MVGLSDPVTVVSARLCEARVWEMFRHVAEPSFAETYLNYAQGEIRSKVGPWPVALPMCVAHTWSVSRLALRDSWVWGVCVGGGHFVL